MIDFKVKVRTISLFLYEKVPILKYHNPDVPIICTRDKHLPWEINVNNGDGNWISIPIDGRSYEGIFADVSRLIDAEVVEKVIIEEIKEQKVMEITCVTWKGALDADIHKHDASSISEG